LYARILRLAFFEAPGELKEKIDSNESHRTSNRAGRRHDRSGGLYYWLQTPSGSRSAE
jgi:hypothetical protein